MPTLLPDGHMQYLKNQAILELKCFGKEALDPKLSGPMLDPGNVEESDRMCDQIMSATDPIKLIDTIRIAATRCGAYVDAGGGGQRARCMLGSIGIVHYVFCLGFASICCTMNDGISIINECIPVQGHTLYIRRFVSRYPRLSRWVKLSGEDWMQAQDDIDGVYRIGNTRGQNGSYSPFMFMTGTEDFSRGQNGSVISCS
jgi:hypothetical protein